MGTAQLQPALGSEIFRDYLFESGAGRIAGNRRVTALGNVPAVGAAPSDIWTGGGIYPWMTGATSLEIVSSSAADAPAGTGARTVLVNGLDVDYNEISTSVTLNGLTPVALTPQFFRIQSMLIMSAGTGKVNAGTITLRNTGAGTTRAIIPAGYGVTRQSQFTVPAGHTLHMVPLFISLNRPGANRDYTIATYVQSSAGFYRMPLEFSAQGNPYRHDGIPATQFPEKTDFGFRCTYTSSVNNDITAAFLGVLERNRL